MRRLGRRILGVRDETIGYGDRVAANREKGIVLFVDVRSCTKWRAASTRS